MIYSMYGLAHLAGWDSYNLHGLALVFLSWICATMQLDPAQPLTTAGEELDDLSVDRSDRSCPSVRGVHVSVVTTYERKKSIIFGTAKKRKQNKKLSRI